MVAGSCSDRRRAGVTTGVRHEHGAQDRRSRGARCWHGSDGSVAAGNPFRARAMGAGFATRGCSDVDPQSGPPLAPQRTKQRRANRVVRARHYGWVPSWTCGGRSRATPTAERGAAGAASDVNPDRAHRPGLCDGCGPAPAARIALFGRTTRGDRRSRWNPPLAVRFQRVVFVLTGTAVDGNRPRGRIYFTTGSAISVVRSPP